MSTQHEKATQILEELKIKAILNIETTKISEAIVILHAIKTYWDLWEILHHFNFIINTMSFKYNETEENRKKVFDGIEKANQNIEIHITLLNILNSER